MTKTLMLGHNVVGKGTYWRMIGFAEELVRLGDDVTVVASTTGRSVERQHKRGVRLLHVPDLHNGSGYDVVNSLRRIHTLRDESFEIVHAFETRPTTLLPARYFKSRGSLVLFDWADWFGRGGSVEQRKPGLGRSFLRVSETFFEQRFRRMPHHTTVINSILYDKALASGVDATDVTILPNGSDHESITLKSAENVRQTLNLPLDAQIITYTGAIFREDAHFMAAIFNQLCQCLPNLYLLLVGYFNVDIVPLLTNPEQLIQTGPVSREKLADYIAAADFGWLPLCNSGANQGRFPLKTNDFVAAGRPMIVSDVGDLGTFVRQHALGWVAPPTVDRHVATLQEALQTVVSAEWQQAIRAKAVHELSWATQTAKLHQLYTNLLQTT